MQQGFPLACSEWLQFRSIKVRESPVDGRWLDDGHCAPQWTQPLINSVLSVSGGESAGRDLGGAVLCQTPPISLCFLACLG